jgi:hypothetical protein
LRSSLDDAPPLKHKSGAQLDTTSNL